MFFRNRHLSNAVAARKRINEGSSPHSENTQRAERDQPVGREDQKGIVVVIWEGEEAEELMAKYFSVVSGFGELK